LVVPAVNVLINAVAKLKIFPRIFVNVEDAKVELPVVKKLAATSVPVFVDDPVFTSTADKLVVEIFVLVEFVIVPLVALIFVRFTFPADKFVTVALVIVELVTFSSVMFAVPMLEVDALLVEA
jgi:hypothetical protein